MVGTSQEPANPGGPLKAPAQILRAGRARSVADVAVPLRDDSPPVAPGSERAPAGAGEHKVRPYGDVGPGAKPVLENGDAARVDVVVLASGNLGLVYFSAWRERLVDALDLPEHLFWVLLSRATMLGLAPGSRPQSARQLQDLALQKADRWHPLLRWLVEEADPASVVGVPLYTSRPVAPWRTTNVTLLGDAIHTMTPLQGLGGNTVLRAAAGAV